MSLLGFSQPSGESQDSEEQEQQLPSQEHISKFRAEIQRLMPSRQWTDDQIKQALGLHGNDTNDAVAFLLAEVDKQEPGTVMDLSGGGSRKRKSDSDGASPSAGRAKQPSSKLQRGNSSRSGQTPAMTEARQRAEAMKRAGSIVMESLTSTDDQQWKMK